MKDLNTEEIQQFSSIADFERAYFLSLVQKPEAAPAPKNPLGQISAEDATFLSTAKFSTTKPFSGEKIEIEIAADKLNILKSGESKIFGKVVTELISKTVLFESLAHTHSQAKLKTWAAAITAEKLVTETFAFTAEKNEVWMVELTAKKSNHSLMITMTDKTAAVAKQLGKEGGAQEKKSEEEPKKKPVDMIIFRYTMTPNQDTKRWVTKTSTLLKKAELWPAENRPKFIVIRYEEDAHEKAEFSHPFIDDMICLPFDRLVFLQKIELALALPKKPTPSFLFVQQAEADIEIAKKTALERTNDLGFAIANPVPLALGTPGHFYFRLPGQKPLLDVHGKVTHSVPHPEIEGQYLVYFNFFGVSKLLNKEIKAYLARDSAYKPLLDQDASRFSFNPENIFLTEPEKVRKTVAVLDVDETVVKNVVDSIRKDIGNVDVVSDDSYFSFFKKFLDHRPDTEKAPPATGEDFFAEFVSILIGTSDLNLQMALTPPGETDKFLGHEARALFAEPQTWLELFDIDARNLLTESLHLALSVKRVQKNFELKNMAGEKRTLTIEFALEDTGNQVRLNFKIPDARTAMKASAIAKIDSLECILIDYALLPEDLGLFFTGLRDGLKKANVRTLPGGPRVVVMASESQKINFERLLESEIFAVLYKPLEGRRMLYLVTQGLASPFSMYSFENIGWKTEHIAAKLARPAKITELSEFGATILSTQALKPTTMLYLFKSIFASAPDQNLCVRVYHSEEDEETPGTYINSVVYFGITDAFLKFTRSYIRETYASKKSKESGGGGGGGS